MGHIKVFDPRRKLIPVWQEWQQWTECSKECGGGIRRRARICGDNTRPRECEGEKREAEACNEQICRKAFNNSSIRNRKLGP